MLFGCVSINKADVNTAKTVQALTAPSYGKAGIYIIGSSIPRDLWLDGHCLGPAGKNGFFYQEVDAGTHVVSTESEFSPNHLIIKTEPNKFYYIQQYTKPSLITVSSDVKEVKDVTGKKAVNKATLSELDHCYRKEIKLPQY